VSIISLGIETIVASTEEGYILKKSFKGYPRGIIDIGLS
jgi:hypothetical protein